MTSLAPDSVEPSEGDIRAAAELIERFDPEERIGPWSDDIAGAIADLLASQRAEIVSRYEVALASSERNLVAGDTEPYGQGWYDATTDLIARIREAAPK